MGGDIKRLALFMGSFLMPKQINKGLQIEEPLKVVVRAAKTGTFSIEKGNSKFLHQLQSSGLVRHVDIYGEQIIEDLKSGQEPKLFSVYQISNDFFGVFQDQDLNSMKLKVLDVYKLIFRFSIGKLVDYLGKPELMIMILQYLQDTQMERVHTRSVLAKNKDAYYRAMENIMNEGALKEQVVDVWKQF